jgi:hypothetical protein
MEALRGTINLQPGYACHERTGVVIDAFSFFLTTVGCVL